MFYKIFIKSNIFRQSALIVLFSTVLLSFGCESPSLQKKDAAATNANAQGNENAPVSALEQDLQTMRTANFDYIYVFRRKDGGVLDGEDKKYLKANSPIFTNRFILSEEDKAAIAGSSYKFEAQNLEKLQERFVMENFSKPEPQDAPANANSNKQGENNGGK